MNRMVWVMWCLIGATTTAGSVAPDGHPPHADPRTGWSESSIVVQVRPGLRLEANDERRLTLRPPHGEGSPAGTTTLPIEVAELERASNITPANRVLARAIGLDRYYAVELGVTTDPTRAVGSLGEREDLIESVSRPVRAVPHASWAASPRGDSPQVGSQFGDRAPIDTESPNDMHFRDQYALHNEGQPINGQPGTPASDINVLETWDWAMDLSNITVAVIDSGVSESHPDLQERVLPGANMFCPPDTPCFQDSDDGASSHGTHVAGIIGATRNNGIGVAGVASGVRILPVKVLNAVGFGLTTVTANGIIWAVDQGADVISISIGHPGDDPYLRDAVEYAYQSGVVICASTGNLPLEPVAYPAAYERTIAVGATDNNDAPASFMSTGPELSVVAPGIDICSTWDAPSDPDSVNIRSGTSQACPHVAGVAALILASDPTLTPDEVREAIENSASDLGDPGWDPEYGHGRVDTLRAIAYANCPADIAGAASDTPDGRVDWHDMAAYLHLFAANDPRADITAPAGGGSGGIGAVDLEDLQEFIDDFNNGCGPDSVRPQ